MQIGQFGGTMLISGLKLFLTIATGNWAFLRHLDAARDARKVVRAVANPLPAFSVWEAEVPPRVHADVLRFRARAHAPSESFASAQGFVDLFGQADTVAVQRFAAREIYCDYKGKKMVRQQAEAPSSLSEKQTKAGSNWVQHTFPKHVKHAVKIGRLDAPPEQYLQLVTVRSGAHPKSVVVKLGDFVKIYRS